MRYTETRIYKRCLQLVGQAAQVINGFPKGYSFLADQLRRAVSSIPLNYAEGCGKQSKQDRRRYFLTARGSANEVVAILDVAKQFGIVEGDAHREAIEAADHLAAMLSRFH